MRDAAPHHLHGRQLEQNVEAGHQADHGAEVCAKRRQVQLRSLQADQLTAEQVVLAVSEKWEDFNLLQFTMSGRAYRCAV